MDPTFGTLAWLADDRVGLGVQVKGFGGLVVLGEVAIRIASPCVL
jgi:hypothetical protein